MVQMRDAAGTPVMITPGVGGTALARVVLGTGEYNEAWLQMLVQSHPELLPLGRIEPAFADAVPIACEVPCAHGFIDNLFLTPRGDIVLIEVKLWKNPQARREMVAQLLDYVAALMTMDYQAFEQALAKARPTRITSTLWDLFKDHPDAGSEADFIDAVSANLARGRLLALAVGDGVRAEARALASLLQSHAGAHFSLALVELGLWEDKEAGRWLCLPSTLLQTVLVERGIVRVEQGVAKVLPVPTSAPGATPQTLTGTMFLEQLAAVDPTLPQALAAFVARLAPLGVVAEQKASLSLKADVGGPKLVNLSSISKSGQLWTDYLSNSVPVALATRYNQQLAHLIGGKVAATPTPRLLAQTGGAPLVSALLPKHQDAWVDIIAELLAAARTAQDDAA
ncbi:hypothetical protein [Sphingomonas rubra]|uniref:Uncharacterized protein n=1 Tax=Sphingomonas rubra TaxID=634430 RepID=A0A1I5TSM7_9SPHN|nr:hypothetical protein [Sphingomonas rubra]SFP85921.1 hypothetical protein SAMN04488241_10914 [Sphingomonas rubra]